MIHFESVNNNGGLQIRLVDEINFDNALDDEEVAVASVGAHYLSTSGSVQCTALRLFTNNESISNEGVFRAVEMTFQDRFTVFFDPFWIDGLRLGTGNAADLWLAEDRSTWRQQLVGPLQQIAWSAELAGDSTQAPSQY